MTSKELYSQFASLEANLQQNKYLLDAVRSMSNRQTEITESHARSLTIGDEEQVELNGEVIALTPSSQQKLIASRQIKMIQEKKF